MVLPPSPTEQPASKAELVVLAARRLFMENGYGATSMEAVARAAGVSKATLYAHFAGKAELFSAIIGTECRRIAHTGDASELDHLPVGEALFRIGRPLLELVVSPQALAAYRVVVAEAARFPELGRAFYEAGPATTLRMLAGYLERATARGDLAVADPQTGAVLLASMIRSHFQLFLLLGVRDSVNECELDRHVRAVIELFLSGCAPRA